ncbi:hypothetical protein [Capnocytophaga sputigena]|jgi:DNA methylase N-4/N-6 domain protein
MNEYQEFLKNKIKIAPKQGFECSLDEINPRMKPHNRLMVKWMVEGGRRACFASFGLHKTVTQLEALRVVLQKLGGGKGLIVCPLSVRQEFVEDAKNILGWEVAPKFIRRIEETDGKDVDPFGGLMTVPYRAVLKGRYGVGFELNPQYFLDGAVYCEAAKQKVSMPTLFDLIDEAEAAQKQAI